MISPGSKILILHDGTWSAGTAASFRKDDGSVDALINGLVITCKRNFWQALPSTLTEDQMVEEAIRFNITALANNSVVRKYRNNPDGEADVGVIVDALFDDDDYIEETYSDDCDCDGCRAARGEEV